MNNTTIVHLPPGKVADPKFISEAIVKFPTVFGFSLQFEGGLVSENHPKVWTAEEIDTVLGKENADGHRVILLGNWADGHEPDDIPPYVLQTDEGDPILSMFYEGDFTKWSGMNGNHTDEYNVSDEVVFPAIQKAYADAGKDYDKFLELLRGQKLQQTLKNTYQDRGYFLFLPKHGDPIVFGKNQAGDEYTWGSASNVSGMSYKEKEDAPAPVAETTQLSFLERMRNKSAPASPPPPAPSMKNVAPAAAKTDTKDIQPVKGDVIRVDLVEIKCPPNLEKGVKNHWLRLFNGKEPNGLPENHLDKNVSVWVTPEMVEFAKREIKGTKDMRNLVAEIKEFRDNAENKSAPPKAAAGTKLANAPITTAETGKSTVREPSSNYVSTSTVLSAAEKEQQVTLLAGFLEKKHSPLEIQKMEAKDPTYSTETGTTFEERLFLSKDEIMKLVGGNKPALAMILEYRTKYIQASGVKLEDLVSSAKGEEPKAVKSEPSDGKAKPAASTSTGGGLSFLRKAS